MRFLILLAVVSACGESSFEQPGVDDPTARPWQRAGAWYPDDPEALADRIEGLKNSVAFDGQAREARAIITPHAGIDHSGPVAAEIFARVALPDTVILLAPNHGDVGEPIAVWDAGPWLVPGHAIAIHHAAVARLQELSPDVVADRDAFNHPFAHPAEMQLPFIAHGNPQTRLVAISYFDHNGVHFPGFDVARVAQHADAISQLVAELEAAGESVLLLATTDLSHYGSLEQTLADDARLLDPISNLQVQALYNLVDGDQLSICGEVPTAIAMHLLRELGHDTLDLVVRSDSSTSSGNTDSVVGYPGAIAW